jgi:hypothetical protein
MNTTFVSPGTGNRYPDWARLVRSACLTVFNSRSELIEAVNVSQRLQSPSDGEILRKLARDLAGEYGLVAEIDDNGKSVCARLIRPARSTAAPESRELAAEAGFGANMGLPGAAIRAVRQGLAFTRRR